MEFLHRMIESVHEDSGREIWGHHGLLPIRWDIFIQLLGV
jgi:hypothetical protein